MKVSKKKWHKRYNEHSLLLQWGMVRPSCLQLNLWRRDTLGAENCREVVPFWEVFSQTHNNIIIFIIIVNIACRKANLRKGINWATSYLGTLVRLFRTLAPIDMVASNEWLYLNDSNGDDALKIADLLPLFRELTLWVHATVCTVAFLREHTVN